MPKNLFKDITLKCLELDCSMSSCNVLPQLPSVERLICYSNELCYIPKLDKCLYIDCRNNKLDFIPPLPECLYFYCSGNKITQQELDVPKCIEGIADENG
jgi:hypothetical protein